jgi:hypothetical protein
MRATNDALDSAIAEVDRARKRISQSRAPQVKSADDIDYLKAVSYAWFESHRRVVSEHCEVDLVDVDAAYQVVLEGTSKYSARSTYMRALKSAKDALTAVRSQVVLAPAPQSRGAEPAPNFAPLASDQQMQAILQRRWLECQKCIAADAPLAATVMMGGLLEALCLARANRMKDKKPLFTAKSVPLDSRTKIPLPLSQWTLRHYLDVGHELGWMSSSAKDVAAVLRDYRNYIHPEKERSHGVELRAHDCKMFWQVTKSLADQLLGTA